MILKIIYNLKDIGAEHLLENKCQPYAEGVEMLKVLKLHGMHTII